MNLECFYFMRTIVFINSFVDKFTSFIYPFNTQKRCDLALCQECPTHSLDLVNE